MSCRHTITVISHKGGKPEDLCHDWLSIEAYNKTYHHFIQPVQGPQYWAQTQYAQPVPPHKKFQRGRPKKNRRRDADEDNVKGHRDDDLLAQDEQALNEAEEAVVHLQEGPVEINLSQPSLSQDSDMEFMVPASIGYVPPVERYKLNIRRPKQKNISDTSTVDAPILDGPPTTPLLFMPTPRFTRRKADKDPV
ncbi:hypothetical protein GmHk_11G032491 [Glycine max]|nr:hypothetical protein GmHk_11G032491 [Glycine max]